jgi:hypothetical protein
VAKPGKLTTIFFIFLNNISPRPGGPPAAGVRKIIAKNGTLPSEISRLPHSYTRKDALTLASARSHCNPLIPFSP